MLTKTLFYGTQLVLNETEVYIAGKKEEFFFITCNVLQTDQS